MNAKHMSMLESQTNVRCDLQRDLLLLLKSYGLLEEYLERVSAVDLARDELYLDISEDCRQNLPKTAIEAEKIAQHNEQLIGRLVEKIKAEESDEIYLKHKDAIDSVAYSCVIFVSENVAEEAFYRIRDDQVDIEKVSEQMGMNLVVDTAFNVGPVPIEVIHPAIRREIRHLQSGQASEPFKLEEGWAIVYILEDFKGRMNADSLATQATRRLRLLAQERSRVLMEELHLIQAEDSVEL